MRVKIYLSVFLFIFAVPFIAKSQRLFPVYSQYMLNGLALNPAYAGSRDAFNIILSHRTQWVGMDGVPVTSTLSAHAPMKNDRVALGLFVFNETIDVRNNVGIYRNYAFRLKLSKGRLSFGLKGGVDIKRFNWNAIVTGPPDPGYVPDPVFSNNTEQFVIPNFGFGMYYYTNRFFIGLSIPKLLSESFSNGKLKLYHSLSNYNYLFTTGFVTGGHFFKVKPSVLLKYNPQSPFQADFNLTFIFADFLWVGGSYRLEDALVGLIKFDIGDQLRIGYTYDYSLGTLNRFHSGSHEIVLIYDFNFRVKGANPRYF